MKKLEKINSDKFKEFQNDQFSKIVSLVGGEEGNTRGGYDYRDNTCKRRKDPATTACEDVSGVAYDPGDGRFDLDPFTGWDMDDPESPLNGSSYNTSGIHVKLGPDTILGWWS